MSWIKLTNSRTNTEAYYNTDNIVEIARQDEGVTRLAAIAASGSPLSIDTMNYFVIEDVDEVMRKIASAGEPVVGL